MGIIRFALAVCVVTCHIPLNQFHFFNGELAVKAFFVISGFYMALILNEKYASYGSFLVNRFLRIYPVYWTVAFITFIFVLFNHNFVYETYWEFLSIPSFIFIIFTDLFIIGQDMVLFLGLNLLNGSIFYTGNLRTIEYPLYHYLLIGPAWSISIELMFYLIAPFLVKRKPWLIVLVILLSSIFRLSMGAHGFTYDPWSYRFFPFEITYFCLGVLAYKIYAHINKTHGHASTAVMLQFIIIAYIIGFQSVPEAFTTEATFLFPLLLAASIPFIFLHFKSNRWDRYIGDLSYPIYICHQLVMTLFDMHVYPYLPVFWQKIAWVLILGAVILFSMILLKCVQNPIDRYRHSKVT